MELTKELKEKLERGLIQFLFGQFEVVRVSRNGNSPPRGLFPRQGLSFILLSNENAGPLRSAFSFVPDGQTQIKPERIILRAVIMHWVVIK